ncbi:hypothetical protein HYFRA_00007060 [Hymenoscyphus fraxineus]|uniref:Uncharacterized protein n=1 Tax=Hymenoscyphus fraxineus TaxID=746836 RepID=A0A9N9KWB5_9HELO|nr:hypothetical protein HYFRA_00007060 [Hymenoscyphus fraxineus]
MLTMAIIQASARLRPQPSPSKRVTTAPARPTSAYEEHNNNAKRGQLTQSIKTAPNPSQMISQRFRSRFPALSCGHLPRYSSGLRFGTVHRMETIMEEGPSGSGAPSRGRREADPDIEDFDDCVIVSDNDEEDDEATGANPDATTTSATAPAHLPEPSAEEEPVEGLEDVEVLEFNENHFSGDSLSTSSRDNRLHPSLIIRPSSAPPAIQELRFSIRGTRERESFIAPHPIPNPASQVQGDEQTANTNLTVLNEAIDENYFSTLPRNPTSSLLCPPSSSAANPVLMPVAIQKRLKSVQDTDEYIASIIPKVARQNEDIWEGTWLQDAYKHSWNGQATWSYWDEGKKMVEDAKTLFGGLFGKG